MNNRRVLQTFAKRFRFTDGINLQELEDDDTSILEMILENYIGILQIDFAHLAKLRQLAKERHSNAKRYAIYYELPAGQLVDTRQIRWRIVPITARAADNIPWDRYSCIDKEREMLVSVKLNYGTKDRVIQKTVVFRDVVGEEYRVVCRL